MLMTIKDIRIRTGLTQKEFGEVLGIPRWTVVDWERGRRSPADYLIKLIDFYLEKKGEYQK